MTKNYQDFKLIVNGSPGHYTVAAEGPGGVNVDPVAFDFQHTTAVGTQLKQIQSGLAPSGETMLAVGIMLFNALFPIEIVRPFERVMGRLRPEEGLRLRIKVTPKALRGIPWELVYDPGEHRFLADRLTIPIVRFIESTTPVDLSPVESPLRVLYVQANPAGTPILDTGKSEAVLRESLHGKAEVISLREVTPSKLQNALREEPFHLLHYDGHGVFDETQDTGYLVLQDDYGDEQRLSAESLASYLDGARQLRLVVFSACETGVSSAQKRFSGLADQLMRTTQIPAVLAMQYDIPDTSARAFTRGFYGAIADGYPIDAATVEGRKEINALFEKAAFAQPDWATPVLFMKVDDGDLFRTKPKGEPEMSEKSGHEHRVINMGPGGKYIEGNLHSGGGDIVLGDKIVQRSDFQNADLVAVFNHFYQQIEARPADPVWEKAQIKNAVQQIEEEAKKGDQAVEPRVSSWLQMLENMAPDIYDVVVETLANPIKGVTEVIQKIAQRAKSQK